MYDVCAIVQRADVPPSKVFPVAKARTGAFEFWSEPVQRVTVGREIARGASGKIYEGHFGSKRVAIKINDPRKVALQTDADEVWMQIMLHCHLLQRHREEDMADVPATHFAARLPGVGRAVGMDRVDRSLLSHVQGLAPGRAQIRALRDAVARVARLLQVLQDDLQFVHGDLHGENVMMSGDDVVLIDFGMSSVSAAGVEGGRRRAVRGRLHTDERYEGAAFHPHLDLLTLLTALREDLAISGHSAATGWCGSFVDPYWRQVRKGLLSGKALAKMPFGAQRTVRSAREEIRDSGEIYYAHHLLYETFGEPTSYPACSPAAVLRALSSPGRTSPPGVATRLFEDV